MAERVYIETTVVSYLTARPNRDVVIAGHQQITHDMVGYATGELRTLCLPGGSERGRSGRCSSRAGAA